MTERVNAGGIYTYLHFAIMDTGAPDCTCGPSEKCVVMSVFDRSKENLQGFWANMHKGVFRSNVILSRVEQLPYKNDITQISMGKENGYHLMAYNLEIGTTLFLTTKARLEEDFYSYLMTRFNLPLLKEWSQPLLDYFCSNSLAKIGHKVYGLAEGEEENIRFNLKECGGVVTLSDIQVVRLADSLTQESLVSVLQILHRQGKVKIANSPQKPIKVDNLDSYLQQYGQSVVDNMKKVIKPLTGLKGVTDNVALRKLRLYPQQLAILNGAQACLKKNNFTILNEGMGTGKTITSIGIVDGLENQKWLDKHPGATLADCFSSSDNVAYRCIVMAPAHLISKWAAEIRNNIPYAKVYVLSSFEDVLAIKERPRKATEKEFYVVGKDFAKLSYSMRPAVSEMGIRPVGKFVCDNCGAEKKERGLVTCSCGCSSFSLESRYVCSKCGQIKGKDQEGACECGGNWLKKPISQFPRKERGLICPSCDNLIWPYQNEQKWSDEEHLPLWPEDFKNQVEMNSKCYVCGEPLWEPMVSNIGNTHKSKWYIAKHYTNAKKKSTSTSWVYDGREPQFEATTGKTILGKVADRKCRRYSPATYIKKHLKGWFDYAIFDEAQNYKGGATAQGNAMEALVKASKKQLLLTGTLLNGYANSIFYLLYRVAPGLMKKHGFGWGDEMAFAKQYGVVTTTYEFVDTGRYNKTSRGKQLTQPKVRPGINPMIIVDFLLPYQLTLDLSDMSKFLPPLKESVIPIEPDGEMFSSYHNTIQTLNAAKYTPSGAKCGSDKLQFALSYPDKPYGRSPIISSVDGSQLACPNDCSFLVENGQLLGKEAELVKRIKEELDEGRNSVVFAEYTNSAETIVTTRLKAIIEDNIPELQGKVAIIESGHPKASKREEWMHDRAREGVRCFITNPKNVETGLDFVWSETDQWGITTTYNFPTLHFFQTGYNLFTLWQASRRSYRLCQTEECRTYYYAYKRTIQMDVLQILAEKQTATAAIQGKFSAEGLARMARQVDPRVKLAQALQGNSEVDEEQLVNMFDAINSSNNSTTENESEIMADYKPMLLFEEVVGCLAADETIEEEINRLPEQTITTEYCSSNFDNFLEMGEQFGWFTNQKKAVDVITADNLRDTLGETKVKNKVEGQVDFFSLMF